MDSLPDSPCGLFLPVRPAPAEPDSGASPLHIDACGMRCPVPVLRLRKALGRSAPGQVIILSTDDPTASSDIPRAIRALPAQLFGILREGDRLIFTMLRR